MIFTWERIVESIANRLRPACQWVIDRINYELDQNDESINERNILFYGILGTLDIFTNWWPAYINMVSDMIEYFFPMVGNTIRTLFAHNFFLTMAGTLIVAKLGKPLVAKVFKGIFKAIGLEALWYRITDSFKTDLSEFEHRLQGLENRPYDPNNVIDRKMAENLVQSFTNLQDVFNIISAAHPQQGNNNQAGGQNDPLANILVTVQQLDDLAHRVNDLANTFGITISRHGQLQPRNQNARQQRVRQTLGIPNQNQP